MDVLNSVARGENLTDIIPADKLPVKELLILQELRACRTKYGQRFIAHLPNNKGVFLPKRISEHLSKNPEVLKEVEDKIAQGTLHLKYLGTRFNNMEFVNL